MQILEEYKRSLKMAEAEEILDLIFYRPIAYVIVKLIYRLPITPNQVTLISLVAGLVSAYCFSFGSAEGFALGGLWYAIANVFDCGDGMLARLQKSGTPFGRLVDGIVDWAISIAIFAGLAIGMHAWTANALWWFPVVAAGLVSGYHAMVFDKRQQEYISAVRGEEDFGDRETTRVEGEIDRLKREGRAPLRQLGLSVYRKYMKMQNHAQEGKQPGPTIPPELYRLHNHRIMRWWTWLGPTTNRTLLMLAGVAARPEIFIWIVLIPANLYLVVLRLWQQNINRQVEATLNAAFPPNRPQAR